MTTETKTAARADIMQLTDDEIDAVGGGIFPLVVAAIWGFGAGFAIGLLIWGAVTKK